MSTSSRLPLHQARAAAGTRGALREFGFRALIAPSYGGIFYNPRDPTLLSSVPLGFAAHLATAIAGAILFPYASGRKHSAPQQPSRPIPATRNGAGCDRRALRKRQFDLAWPNNSIWRSASGASKSKVSQLGVVTVLASTSTVTRPVPFVASTSSAICWTMSAGSPTGTMPLREQLRRRVRADTAHVLSRRDL